MMAARLKPDGFGMVRIAGLGLALFGFFSLAATVSTNLTERNIRTGFDFLGDRAGFAIGETLIAYAPSSSYAFALLAGLTNTLLIAVLCIAFSTVLGLGVCAGRLSPNWLLARLSLLYVEFVRNLPLLLQMFVWYAVLLFGSDPYQSGPAGLFSLDNRGAHLPFIRNGWALPLALAAAILVFLFTRKWKLRDLGASKRIFASIASFAAILGLAGQGLSFPEGGRFGVSGGLSLSTEFLTLVIGLSVYTSAYLAEIFRAAFLAVPLGQHEAASALGLSRNQKVLRVVMPQAVRIAIPPMTSWHLNTIKNSTLGVAIGYPEFVSVVDTVISQTGQAIEGVGLIVVTFLLLSLSLSFATARYAQSFGWMVTGQPGRSMESGYRHHVSWNSLGSVWDWSRRTLFPTGTQTVLSIGLLLLGSMLGAKALAWLLFDATFSGGATECGLRSGACWPFIQENARLILFGTYPDSEIWRAAMASVILLGCLGLSFVTRLWGRRLVMLWIAGICLALLLMRGGFGLFSFVPMDKWSGLPVTLLLASIAVAAAFPLAVLLAFARRSKSTVMRGTSTAFIELMRGTPLIGVLFLAAVMFPLFVPSWLSIDSLPRVQLALVVFTAAYMAEAIRGGLLAVAPGQGEAAQALGFSKWQARRLIILPQALKVSLPGLVNTSISEVKNTTLVLIVGVFDLLQTTRLSFLEAQWRPYFAEAYVFTGTIFFAICFSLSQLSMKIERKLSYGQG
jgi:general L-amino acid transport system permease protein